LPVTSVRAGVLVTGPRRVQIHTDDLRLLGERGFEHRLQTGEIETHEANHGPDRHGVLHDRQLFAGRRQLGHGQRTELDAFRRLGAGSKLRAVVERHATGGHFLQMAVERVLVQRDESCDLIAVAERLLGGDSQA
jgi:hypothetical protein